MNSLFGTDGIRGTIGQKPFTQDSLLAIGHAITRWLCQYTKEPAVIIAQDPRASSDWIKATLQSAILQSPVKIYDAGILPTPALPLLIKKMNLDAGVMISASHNPHTDNGIKLFDRAGKLKEEDEKYITNCLTSLTYASSYNNFGTLSAHPEAIEHYTHIITQHVAPSFLLGKKIVLDCANGAMSACAPQLFELLGATVIPIACTPNGRNINDQCGSIYPTLLQQMVIEHAADAGFAFDGDGDRVIAINKMGTIKNGDDIVALLSTHPAYIKQKVVMGTIMSNQGLEEFLAAQDKQLMRTPVGDKHITQALKAQSAMLGGEQSGHIIMTDYTSCGDGLFTALRLLETIIQHDNWAMESFDHYPQFQLSIPIKFRKNLSEEPFKSLIDAATHKTTGRVLVRYSGTQPIVRIMVEDKEKEIAHQIGMELAHNIKPYLQELK